MAGGISGFRKPEDRERYHRVYDRFLEAHWPTPRAEIDVETSFGSTHVGRTGDAAGTPLVLIHPTSGSSLGWHSLIGPLAEEHTVYTPDTIGTVGRSVQTAPVESDRDLSRWLDEVIDGLSLDRIHLVGYSEGGWVAAVHTALTDRPERIQSLVLIEPAGAIGRVPGPTLAGMVWRGAWTLVAKDKPAAVRSLSRWLNGSIELSDDEVHLALAAFSTFRQRLPKPTLLTDDELRRITMPTLLLLGAETRLYDPDVVADRARALLPDVQVETTPGAGHGLPYQFPEATTERILSFVD